MGDSGFINFRKEDFQTDEGVAQLNRILNLLAINLPGDTENIRIYSGYGSPEGVVTAGIGSIYMRADGSTGTSVYQKESGTGNTGWVANANLTLPLSVANGGTGQNFSSGALGSLIYFSNTGVMSLLSPGASGSKLYSLGAFDPPEWQDNNEGIRLIDQVVLSGSTATTGGISITTNARYKIFIEISNATGSSNTISMTFNNDTSGNNYEWLNTNITIAASPAQTHTGSITGNLINLATIRLSNGELVAEIDLSTYTPVFNTRLFGSGIFYDTSAVHNRLFVAGSYNGGTPTSFEVFGGGNISGNVWLYKLAD